MIEFQEVENSRSKKPKKNNNTSYILAFLIFFTIPLIISSIYMLNLYNALNPRWSYYLNASIINDLNYNFSIILGMTSLILVEVFFFIIFYKTKVNKEYKRKKSYIILILLKIVFFLLSLSIPLLVFITSFSYYEEIYNDHGRLMYKINNVSYLLIIAFSNLFLTFILGTIISFVYKNKFRLSEEETFAIESNNKNLLSNDDLKNNKENNEVS